jgi:hypothetical protein
MVYAFVEDNLKKYEHIRVLIIYYYDRKIERDIYAFTI